MKLSQSRILVIDDDPDVLTAVQLLLKRQVLEVNPKSNPEHLPALLANNYDVLLLDMNFISSVNTGNEGIYWLRKVKELSPSTSVIMITAYGEIDLAVRALKEGADDFIVKPWHNEKLLETISEVLSRKGKKAGFKESVPADEIANSGLIGESQVMKDIFQKIRKIAATDANILILGENGTGKDLVANAIFQNSARHTMPYVKVDIGSLTESLFESELFGHKKGAFTDAKNDRTGFFESANGGTLFLDEIGNITLPQQSKLLSVLQNRQVIRLGSNEPKPIDIRLICATNLPLQELANENRFRKDLIYRIKTIEIVIPPLRQRENDVLLPARHFAKIYSEKYMKPAIEFEKGAQEKLRSYHFPGNVRELQYTIERAVIMADKAVLKADDLLFSPIESASAQHMGTEDSTLSAVERNTILRVIEKNNGNISKAAKELGITRTALY